MSFVKSHVKSHVKCLCVMLNRCCIGCHVNQVLCQPVDISTRCVNQVLHQPINWFCWYPTGCYVNQLGATLTGCYINWVTMGVMSTGCYVNWVLCQLGVMSTGCYVNWVSSTGCHINWVSHQLGVTSIVQFSPSACHYRIATSILYMAFQLKGISNITPDVFSRTILKYRTMIVRGHST
jgi:hypothetical protein